MSSNSYSLDENEIEYKLYLIKSYDNLEISYNRQIMYFYNYIQMYDYQLYKIQKNGKLYRYVMLKSSFEKLFSDFEIEIYNGMFNGKIDEYSIIDESFFGQLYETKNKDLNSCMSQLIIFKNNSNIIEKCKKMKNTYIISKVAIKMFDICAFTNYNNTDSSFIIKIKVRNLNISEILLQLCSDKIKIVSDHRTVINSLKPIIDYENLDNHITKIFKTIKIMIGDIVLEYSLCRSEPYFIERLYRIDNVNEEFIELLKRKNNGAYKYCYNDIATILGYDTNNSEHNKSLTSIINDPEQNFDYQITKNTDSRFDYLITRIDFYKICKKSGKPKAKIFLEYFDYLYEQAIDYLKYSKKEDKIIDDLTKENSKLKMSYNKLNQKFKLIKDLFLKESNRILFIKNSILNPIHI